MKPALAVVLALLSLALVFTAFRDDPPPPVAPGGAAVSGGATGAGSPATGPGRASPSGETNGSAMTPAPVPQQPPTPEEAAGPQALFARVKAFLAAGDERGFFALLTSAGRIQVLMADLMGATVAILGADMEPDPSRQAALSAILERHGLKLEESGRLHNPHGSGPAGMTRLLAPVADPASLHAELVDFTAQHVELYRPDAIEGLRVEGDRATATMLLKNSEDDVQRQAVTMERRGEDWFLMLPIFEERPAEGDETPGNE